jgi:hypothetical protein
MSSFYSLFTEPRAQNQAILRHNRAASARVPGERSLFDGTHCEAPDGVVVWRIATTPPAGGTAQPKRRSAKAEIRPFASVAASY